MQGEQIEIDTNQRVEIAATEPRRSAKGLETMDGWWSPTIDAAEDAGIQMISTVGILHPAPGDDLVNRRQAALPQQFS